MSSFINGRGELCVVLAFGESNSLILRFSDGILVGLMVLDEGAVDKAQLALWFSSQVCMIFFRGQPTPIGVTNGRSCSKVPNEMEVPAINNTPAGGGGLPGGHRQRREEVFRYSVFSLFSISLVEPI